LIRACALKRFGAQARSIAFDFKLSGYGFAEFQDVFLN